MYLSGLIRSFFEQGTGRVFAADGTEVPAEDLRREFRSIRTYVLQRLRPGQRLAIRLPYDYRYLLSIYVCMESGVPYVPLQPDWPDRRVEQIRALSRFDLVLDAHNIDQALATPPDAPATSSLGADDPLYVMFTSGSTGEPKGVVIPRRAYENYLRWMDGYFGAISSDDRMLAVTRFTFDIIGMDIGLLLLRRFSLYFSAYGGNPFRLASEIQRSGITCLNTVPNNGMLLTSPEVLPRANLTSLRHLMLGGARFPHLLLRRLRKDVTASTSLYNFYGPTEVTIYTHVKRLDGSVDDNHHNANVTIGRPIRNVSCLLVGSEGDVVTKPFTDGELWLGGAQLMLGYCNNPEKTAEVLTVRDGVRYYRTGDRAFVDGRGKYYIIGRLDDCIKRRGYRVDLLDIDAYIQQVSGVKDCVTLAFDDVAAENLLVTVIVPSEPVTGDELRQRMKTVLVDYQIPDFIEIVDAFPLNNAGKVDRKELARMFRPKVTTRTSPERRREIVR